MANISDMKQRKYFDAQKPTKPALQARNSEPPAIHSYKAFEETTLPPQNLSHGTSVEYLQSTVGTIMTTCTSM